MSINSARKLAARSLRSFPKAKVAVRRLDRSVSARADRLREEFREQRGSLFKATRVLSGDAVAEAGLAAVLDGRTLNVDIRVSRFRHDDVRSAELRVVRGSDVRLVPARLRPESDGSLSVEAAVLLDDSPGGLALRPGTQWLLEVVLRSEAHGEQILKVLGGPQKVGTRGLTVPSPPHPETGLQYHVRVVLTGRVAVTVRAPEPTAELDRLDLDWLRAALEIRMVGRPLAMPATIEIVKANGTSPISVPVQPAGPDRVRCDLPLAKLAAVSKGTRAPSFHVFLRSGGRRFRVGRTLHDLRNPKNILKPTPTVVSAAPGQSVRMVVRFTATGALTFTCRPL